MAANKMSRFIFLFTIFAIVIYLILNTLLPKKHANLQPMPPYKQTSFKSNYSYQTQSTNEQAKPQSKQTIDSFYRRLDCSLLFIAKQRLNYLRKRQDSMPTSLEHLERASKHLDTQQWSYYSLLGLPIDASTEEIASRYRKISAICHPDKYSTQSDEVQCRARTAFENLRTIYTILSTPQTRALYDYWSLNQFDELEFTRFLNKYK
jgi:hypothetical protein